MRVEHSVLTHCGLVTPYGNMDLSQHSRHQAITCINVDFSLVRFCDSSFSSVWWVWNLYHDDVIKWKHFTRCWPFEQGIHRFPVNSPHKGQWRGALMFSLICARINGWVNNREAGDLRRYHAHYDVIIMLKQNDAISPRGQWRNKLSQIGSYHTGQI